VHTNRIKFLYLIKEFQRLKEEELKQLGWDIRRNLAKINYRIHTDAIKDKGRSNILTVDQGRPGHIDIGQTLR
jgi:hypothetical protein